MQQPTGEPTMQLEMKMTPDLSIMYRNNKYETFEGKEAKRCDKLIKQALKEAAENLKLELEKLYK
jgi:hypothetical protein